MNLDGGIHSVVDSKHETRKEEENPDGSSNHEGNQNQEPSNSLANDNRLKFLSFLRDQWYVSILF